MLFKNMKIFKKTIKLIKNCETAEQTALAHTAVSDD